MTGAQAGAARWSTLGLLLVMGAAWGLEFSLIKLATQAGYPPVGVLLVSLALIAAAFWLLLALRRSWFAPTRKVLVFLFVVAMLGYVLPLLAALWAAPRVPAGVMSLIASFTPVVAVAAALATRSEPVSPRRILAIVLGLASAVVVLLPHASLSEMEMPEGGSLVWLLVVFVVPLTYGIESIYVSVAWPEGLDPLQIAAGQSVVALLAVLAIQLLFGAPIPFDPAWPAGQLAVPAVAACVLVEVLLYFVIIGRSGGVLVNFSMYVSLCAGLLWGAVIFGERLDAGLWIALALLAAGLACTVRWRAGADR